MNTAIMCGGLVWGAIVLCACKVEKIATLPEEEISVSTNWEAFSSTIPLQEFVDHSPLEFKATLRRQLAFLSGPQLAGRRIGSNGAQLAQAHIVATFQDLGLVPDGENRGWVQSVPLRLVETQQALIELEGFPVNSASDEGNTSFAVAMRHGHEFVLRRYMEAGQWNHQASMVDVGYGISISRLEHDDYEGKDVRGKIVVVHAGVPNDNAKWKDSQNKKFGEFDYKLRFAQEAGAVGCILLSGLKASSPEWIRISHEWMQPFVQSARRSQTQPKQLQFAAVIAGESAKQLNNWLASQGLQVEAGVAKSESGGEEVKLAGSKRALVESAAALARVSIQSEERWLEDSNVVARLPGSENPDQAVIIIAHYDAGGFSTPSPQGGGLVDNATGVAMLTAIAAKSMRWVAEGHFPKRSLLFVASTAASIGMWGAQKYVRGGLVHRDNVTAVVNLDSFSVGYQQAGLFVVDAEWSNLQSQLAKTFSIPVDFVSSSAPEFASLDHIPFLGDGMVALSITDQVPSDIEKMLSPTIELPAEGAYSGENIQHIMGITSDVFDLIWQFADNVQSPSLLLSSPEVGE